MSHFSYHARDIKGNPCDGFLIENSRTEVAAHLREQNLFIVDISEISALWPRKFIFRYRKVTHKQLTLFCRQLSVMINSGLPLLSGLKVLCDQAENVLLKEALKGISRRLKEGESFSASLSAYPNVFPPIVTTMVGAGEAGGVLDDIFGRIASYLEWEYKIREKVKSSVTYPIVVFVISALAVNFIIVFILPVFGKILGQMNADMPLLSRLMLKISQILRRYWYLIIGFWAVLIVCGHRARKSKGRVRELIDLIVLKVPVFGGLVHKIILSRFCRTMAVLLRVGIPVLSALEIVEKTLGNVVVEKGIACARKTIFDGQGMAEPLKQSGVFTPLVVEMVRVGEETGSLSVMLEKAGDFYDEEVDNLAGKLGMLVEPILVVFTGAIVCVVLLSVFLPMFKVISAVS